MLLHSIIFMIDNKTIFVTGSTGSLKNIVDDK